MSLGAPEGSAQPALPASRAPGCVRRPWHSVCSPPPLYEGKWVRAENQSEVCGRGCGRGSQQRSRYVSETEQEPTREEKRGRSVGPGGDSALGAGPASWPSEASAAATASQRPTEAPQAAVSSDYS